MTPHDLVLVLHNGLRWVVLATGLVAVLRSASAARVGRPWTQTDTAYLRAFVSSFDAQLLLGFVLYFGTSALGLRMLLHADVAIKTSALRFFAIEHAFGMFLSATLLHVGAARGRRLGASPARHRHAAFVGGLAFVILVASVPWPYFPYARPLLRGL